MPGPFMPPAPRPLLGEVLTQPQTPEAWKPPLPLLAQRYQPGASTPSPAWRDPRCPESGQEFGNAQGLHMQYSFKDPSNLGRGRGPWSF